MIAFLRLAIDIAVAVMLEKPVVNRAVMNWVGTDTGMPRDAMARSAALWRMALEKDASPVGPD
ncbi:MAG: hypothetical protein QM681_04745 [Novosphingobium sp.]